MKPDHSLPDAEDMNYFKTGKSNPGKWMSKAEKVIQDLGGTVIMRAKGRHGDRTAFALEFEFEPDSFRAIWPVLPTRTGSELAAERQAATMLYHDVKARSLRCKIMGPRTAFFDFLMLEDGRTATQLTSQELLDYTPRPLLPGSQES